MTTSPNKMSDEDMGEILKQAFAGTVTMREITEGEKMKYHPYWAYANGKLFCFDFNFSKAFELIKQHQEAYALEARLDERNKIALDNYRGKTVSESTNWQAEFGYFINNNERRIAELKAQQEEFE